MKSIIVFFVGFIVMQAYASDLEFPEVAGFLREVRSDIYNPDNLYDLINGGSDVYLEYNFIDLHLCEYKKGNTTITVEAYNHGNVENAFGIYATERSSDYNFIDIGTEGYQENDVLNFFKGDYYIKISAYSETGENLKKDILKIAQEIDRAIIEKNGFPEAIKKLPGKNKINYSEAYINNTFLGYSFLNNAYSAEYKNIEPDVYTFKIFVVLAENETEANKNLKMYLEKKGVDLNENKNGVYQVNDDYNGKIFIKASGNMLIGTMNCKNSETAISYFNIIK